MLSGAVKKIAEQRSPLFYTGHQLTDDDRQHGFPGLVRIRCERLSEVFQTGCNRAWLVSQCCGDVSGRQAVELYAAVPMLNQACIAACVLAILTASYSARAGDVVDMLPQVAVVLDPMDVVGRKGEFELSGRVIVRPRIGRDGVAIPSRALTALKPLLISVVESTGEWIVGVPENESDGGFIRRLRATGQFQYVTPDWLCYPARGGQLDPLTDQQWHHTVLQTADAWTSTIGSPDVIVAVVDSGVDVNHPDLVGRLSLPGHNSVGASPLADATGPFTDISSTGHGTRCAGIIAEQNNNAIGGSGVAPGVLVMPVRCTNNASGSALLSDILNGAEWASRNGAQVINISYNGVSSPSVGLRGTILKSFGSLLVYAAGNSNAELSASADWPDVIIVSGIDRADQRYSQSNFGSPIDIAAPGVNILTTMTLNRYATSTGTSFASPQVAAVAALLWSVAPAVSPDDIASVLTTGAIDIGARGRDPEFGAGRLNAARSVALQQGRTLPSLRPIGPLQTLNGLRAEYFLEATTTDLYLPLFYSLQPAKSVTLPSLSITQGTLFPAATPDESTTALLTGYFRASVTGTYSFSLTSFGNARVYLGQTLLVNAESGTNLTTSYASIGMDAGLHSIRVEYSCPDQNALLVMLVQTPTQSYPVLADATMLAHDYNRTGALDIADGPGQPGRNDSVDEGDYNLFFRAFFSDDPALMLSADIADDSGAAGGNGRVTEGDYNFFMRIFFE